VTGRTDIRGPRSLKGAPAALHKESIFDKDWLRYQWRPKEIEALFKVALEVLATFWPGKQIEARDLLGDIFVEKNTGQLGSILGDCEFGHRCLIGI
jgi:hypothetical protein